MAISYVGSTETNIMFGNDSIIQNLLSIENGIESNVNVYVRRLAAQNDALTANTAVMPTVNTSRITVQPTGGILLGKVNFDMSQSSDPHVVIRSANLDAGNITATAGSMCWHQFINRLATTANQQQGQDNNMLPMICANSGSEFVLTPGEMILVQVSSSAVASNAELMNNWFITVAWEEEPVTSFQISGTVRKGGVAQSGSKVVVIQATDDQMSNAFVKQVITTGASGAWTASLATGSVGTAIVQLYSASVYYNDYSKPYLT